MFTFIYGKPVLEEELTYRVTLYTVDNPQSLEIFSNSKVASTLFPRVDPHLNL